MTVTNETKKLTKDPVLDIIVKVIVMFSVSGFIDPTLRRYDKGYVDNSKDFVLGSCGHSVLLSDSPHVSVIRENGREDYQLIYLAKGSYCFHIGDREVVLKGGQALLYKPFEKQYYHSLDTCDVEFYWAHFTGSECENILRSFGFWDENVFYVGMSDKFPLLYKWAIKELQLKRLGYIELATGYFMQILSLMSRNYLQSADDTSESHIAEKAMIYFHRHFNEDISIDDFAKSLNITPCWFRKCFKNRTGVSPKQFINDIRLAYARELLLTSDIKINEIAEQAGYENAYYFSRIFTKNTGVSPMQFRKNNFKP